MPPLELVIENNLTRSAIPLSGVQRDKIIKHLK